MFLQNRQRKTFKERYKSTSNFKYTYMHNNYPISIQFGTQITTVEFNFDATYLKLYFESIQKKI